MGNEQIDAEINAIAARMDTRVDGVPVVVFNTLGWARTDVVEIEVGSIGPERPCDCACAMLPAPTLPMQFLEHAALRRWKHQGCEGCFPRPRRARVWLLALSDDSIGVGVFRRQATGRNPRVPHRPTTRMSGSIENEFYRVTFDLWTGEMKELYDKAAHWDVLGGRPGNIVAREHGWRRLLGALRNVERRLG